ncbi:hypothetical protein PAMC26577_14935 [Caballeronia sordidicola]|uniref:Uncharacterized protein n=1 Tax=Caballeronia sordidicola TaxID=196367 RepID=A0A242MTD4_CABSO|nr:hypothetical protein PAMC26577_14935 [Caballeronia sordidicola]
MTEYSAESAVIAKKISLKLGYRHEHDRPAMKREATTSLHQDLGRLDGVY